MCIQFTDLVFTVSCFQEGRGNVALYHTICTCTLCTYIYTVHVTLHRIFSMLTRQSPTQIANLRIYFSGLN